MNNKVLIIGIDGGTWSILRLAIEDGYMPNLKKIIANGVHGNLESVIPAITPAAWGSFQTGRNPGQNGVYGFYQWDNTSKKEKIVSSRNINNTIWQIATKAGKTVGTLNVPMTYPPKDNSGDIVTGVLTPGIDNDFTWPPELKTELLKAIPDYEILNLDKVEVSPSETDIKTFISIMKQNLDWRFKAAKFMLSKKDYDLFMVHYHASDIIQHGLWCFMDPAHKLFDKNKQQLIFKDFYGHLDSLIQKTIELRGTKDQTCFIVSDHGFQNHLYEYNMASWLLKNGYIDDEYLNYHSDLNNKTPKAKSLIKQMKKMGIGKILKHILPDSAVETLELKTKLKNKSHTYKFDSKVKCISTGRECFISVLDQENKEAIINKLIESLSNLKDKEGNRIAKAVHRKEAIYHGQQIDIIPDLTIVPIDGWTFTFKPKMKDTEIIEINLGNTFHMGTHHPNGIFAATGNGVGQSKEIDFSIMDIAPTVLWLLGIDNSEMKFDGNIISEIWHEDFLQQNEEQNKQSIAFDSTENSSQAYNQDEHDTLEKRLGDLGYM